MKQKLRDGTTIEFEGKQDRMLKKLYGNIFGRILLKPLTKPFISKLAGVFLSSKVSCMLIKSFIEKNNIDMRLYEEADYKSYNDFFCRKIKTEVRPVDFTPKSLISPCDSKLTVLKITDDTRFVIKQTEYSVASLLQNEALAQEYKNGYVLIFRLCVDDYHRYCYIDDAEKEKTVTIQGKLHTVNPIANDYFPIYKENTRTYSILHSKNFSDIVMMEVGALLVGKIVNHHNDSVEVKRGEEKGYFEFGGSTVVVLLKENTAVIDEDILKNSEEDYETVVKYGEKIGIKA